MIIVFDIDGTLIEEDAARIQDLCHEIAASKVLGKEVKLDFDTSGMLDWEIHKKLLGEKGTRENIIKSIKIMCEEFKKRCKEVKLKDYTMEILESFKNFRKTIITGNSREVAIYKLKLAGILEYFDLSISGFGDEFLKRDELLERIAKIDIVLYFGDSKRDYETAKKVVERGYKVFFVSVPKFLRTYNL